MNEIRSDMRTQQAEIASLRADMAAIRAVIAPQHASTPAYAWRPPALFHAPLSTRRAARGSLRRRERQPLAPRAPAFGAAARAAVWQGRVALTPPIEPILRSALVVPWEAF